MERSICVLKKDENKLRSFVDTIWDNVGL
jgi:hypothetical protein